MKSLSVGQRISVAIACMTAVVLVGGNMGFWGLKYSVSQGRVINARIKQQGDFAARSIDLARSAQVNFKKQIQEWKDVLLRGRDPEAFKKHLDGFNQQAALTQEDLKALSDLFGQAKLDTKLVEGSLAEHLKLNAQYLEAIKSFEPQRSETAAVVDRLVKGIDQPATEALDKLVAQAQQSAVENTDSAQELFQTRMRRLMTLFAVGSILGIGLGIACAWAVSRALAGQLADLSKKLEENGWQVEAAATQVSSASHSLAQATSEQAASLEESSASLEEMTSMNKQTASNATKASELMQQTRAAAEQGSVQMGQMNAAMSTIRSSGDEIAKIIKTIDEIAFQTNILALNAAVEAARAGESGNGFAVVAEEVRSLAQRSAEAAKQTAVKIGDAISNTSQGAEISASVGKTFEEIVAQVRRADVLVAEVSAASQEQCRGIEHVNRAVGQMDQVTQGNAANAEQSASAAEELNAQARSLNLVVADSLNLLVGKRSETGGAWTDNLGVPQSVTKAGTRMTSRSNASRRMPRLTRPLNCWEFKQCGREAGGAKARELGVCPAYPDHGRSCAAMAGTLCGGKVQGRFAQKIASCMQCQFYQSPDYDRIQSAVRSQ